MFIVELTRLTILSHFDYIFSGRWVMCRMELWFQDQTVCKFKVLEEESRRESLYLPSLHTYLIVLPKKFLNGKLCNKGEGEVTIYCIYFSRIWTIRISWKRFSAIIWFNGSQTLDIRITEGASWKWCQGTLQEIVN